MSGMGTERKGKERKGGGEEAGEEKGEELGWPSLITGEGGGGVATCPKLGNLPPSLSSRPHFCQAGSHLIEYLGMVHETEPRDDG